MKLHMLCATNRVPISYELTPANVADVELTEELFAEANLPSTEKLAHKVFGAPCGRRPPCAWTCEIPRLVGRRVGRDARRAGQLTAVRVFQVVVDEVLPGTGDRLY